MNIENYIEGQYRELSTEINLEYEDLYKNFNYRKLTEIFSTLHHKLVSLFKIMNERLPTGEYEAHFWADPSRELITTIDISLGLQRTLKNTKYAFTLDEYYNTIIKNCNKFLSSSGGSALPPNMEKIELYYTIPIFILQNTITITNELITNSLELQLIGSGSYANVYKYKDTFYNTFFALKRAKKDLNDKELLRFKQEFDTLKKCNSPYILEVYNYNEEKSEYIMEYMDYSLYSYYEKYNSTITYTERKGIAMQVLKAFEYLQSKSYLHRDINPKNVLLKKYDDVFVVKISDFGLVKTPESTLTSQSTEFKGYFNDPSLVLDGFISYNMIHETYALTRLIYYIMTGKTNIEKNENIQLKSFVEKGLNTDKSKRFKNIFELIEHFKLIINK